MTDETQAGGQTDPLQPIAGTTLFTDGRTLYGPGGQPVNSASLSPEELENLQNASNLPPGTLARLRESARETPDGAEPEGRSLQQRVRDFAHKIYYADNERAFPGLRHAGDKVMNVYNQSRLDEFWDHGLVGMAAGAAWNGAKKLGALAIKLAVVAPVKFVWNHTAGRAVGAVIHEVEEHVIDPIEDRVEAAGRKLDHLREKVRGALSYMRPEHRDAIAQGGAQEAGVQTKAPSPAPGKGEPQKDARPR